MKALITGITGQDGSYLAELLLEKGYEVYGVVRRSSSIPTSRIDHLLHPEEKVKLLFGDLTTGIDSILCKIEPDVIFNTAAMSHVRVSFDVPIYTLEANAVGSARILDCIYRLGLKSKFLQCSSSEMFGVSPPPQNEDTSFKPCSPYGIAKLAAYHITRLYRDAYGVFASNSICFNHESYRRGETFVTKKIVRAAVRLKLGLQDKLILGNLDSMRDWGHAQDYVKAMYLIMQHSQPDDFVIATGQTHTIREFLEIVFERLDLDYTKYVEIDDRYKRPKEVPALLGDSTKIRTILGWEPKYTLPDIIDEMIHHIMREETNGRENFGQYRQTPGNYSEEYGIC